MFEWTGEHLIKEGKDFFTLLHLQMGIQCDLFIVFGLQMWIMQYFHLINTFLNIIARYMEFFLTE